MSLLQCFYCHQDFNYIKKNQIYWCSNSLCSRKAEVCITNESINLVYTFFVNKQKYKIKYVYCFWQGKNCIHYDISGPNFNNHIFNTLDMNELPFINPFLPDDVLESKVQAMLLLK
jgi:hypothetical protein